LAQESINSGVPFTGFRFGPFTIDLVNRQLLRDGELIPLQPKTFDLLAALVERRGRLVTKDELLDSVWPGTAVEESNLSQNVYLLRKVLGQDVRGQPYIETIPRRGYRFVCSRGSAPTRGRPT